MKNRPFDTFFHWMTFSALFAVAFSQFRLVNDLRAIQTGSPDYSLQMPSEQQEAFGNRVKDVLVEQARINRQVIHMLQSMDPGVISGEDRLIEAAPQQEELPAQTQSPDWEMTEDSAPIASSGFDDVSEGDLVSMKIDLMRERLDRFEASLTDADREELDRRLQLQIDQLTLQIADQPLPEEIAVLEVLAEGGKRLSPAEREWRDQTMQSLRKGALMEMYSEHSLFQELQAVDLMQLQVGEF
ncbi:MAG: hypothetical protein O2964_02380 [Verrucomicrobia bacterium]|nr:hypothetical protein [Verrucomicrobiota bacterium]